MLNKKGKELSVLFISNFEWEILCACSKAWLCALSLGAGWVILAVWNRVMPQAQGQSTVGTLSLVKQVIVFVGGLVSMPLSNSWRRLQVARSFSQSCQCKH